MPRHALEARGSRRDDCGGEKQLSIAELSDLSISDASTFLNNLSLNKREEMIAGAVLREVQARLKFLLDVGLNYLSMSRSAGTLSGGEAQRIRLATQIGWVGRCALRPR